MSQSTRRRETGRAGRRARRARGLALVLVLSVLALVAILGSALLSSASLQARAASNGQAALAAECLAEGGVEMAAYYLLHPEAAPTPVAAGAYWTGGTGLRVGDASGAGGDGTVDVAVELLDANVYRVTSVGRSSGGERAVTRRVTAELQVEPGYQVKQASAFAGAAFLPGEATVNGDVQTGGLLTLRGKVTGKVISPLTPLLQLTGQLLGLWEKPTVANTTAIPTAAQVRDYRRYRYLGREYDAAVLASLAAGTVLGPTADNPAGVYYCAGDLAIYSDVTINGTLLVDGAVHVYGGRNVVTAAAPGFPAMVVKGDLYLLGPGSPRDLKVNGLTWLGGAIRSSGTVTGGFFEFTGAVLFGGSGSVDTFYGGKVTVTSDLARTSGVELHREVPPAQVKVLAYR